MSSGWLRLAQRRTQRADLVIVVMFAHVQVAVFRLANRSDDVVSSDEPLVADHIACQLEDHLAFRSCQFGHVMLVAGNRFGPESNLASQIRDDQRSVTCRLVLPSPQLALAGPGPAQPQGPAPPGDRAPAGLPRPPPR